MLRPVVKDNHKPWVSKSMRLEVKVHTEQMGIHVMLSANIRQAIELLH